MFERIGKMLGLGAWGRVEPAGGASDGARASNLDLARAAPKLIAQALERDPGLVPRVARELPVARLLGVLTSIARSDVKVALAATTLQVRPDQLASGVRLGEVLTPLERELVRARAGGDTPEMLLRLLGLEAPNQALGSTNARDVKRLVAERVGVPPILASVMSAELLTMVSRVRAGAAGFAADDRRATYERLASLDQGQRLALRKLLVFSPPHPRLRELQKDEALTGPPTPAALMKIVSGELFGETPRPSPALAARATQLVDAIGRDWSKEQRESWVAVLSRSDTAVRLVERTGMPGLLAISRFPTELLDEVTRNFGTERQLAALAARGEATIAEVEVYLRQHGASGTAAALDALTTVEWTGLRDLVGQVGFTRAVELAQVAGANDHGVRALRHLRGDAGLVEVATTSTPAAFKRALADAAARIHSFGTGHVALETGAGWPALDPPRTAKVVGAEAALAQRLGVAPSALSSAAPLDPPTRSRVVRAMKDAVRAQSPALADALDRELAGRRFVAARYYDELYAAGVKNPEHRYSVQTFESWQRGDALVRARAEASRGRPLAKGELVEVARAAHREAAEGMLGVHETHMKPDDAGRLRATDADHVQLGEMLHPMSRDASKLLDQNPYLASNQVVMETDQGVSRTIFFAKGSDVSRLMSELDDWARANEGKLAPAELAAEVHFRMVSIHPFMDGNGRTSKLMADFILQRAGVEPPVWRSGDVLLHRAEWPKVVEEGVAFTHATVERYFRTAVADEAPPRPAPRPRPPPEAHR